MIRYTKYNRSMIRNRMVLRTRTHSMISGMILLCLPGIMRIQVYTSIRYQTAHFFFGNLILCRRRCFIHVFHVFHISIFPYFHISGATLTLPCVSCRLSLSATHFCLLLTLRNDVVRLSETRHGGGLRYELPKRTTIQHVEYSR